MARFKFEGYRLPNQFFDAMLTNIGRSKLEGVLKYDPGPDHSMELTAVNVMEAACAFIEDGHREGDGLRSVYVGGFQLLCVAGIPADVSALLRYGIRVPAHCEGKVCFFVLHARRVSLGAEFGM